MEKEAASGSSCTCRGAHRTRCLRGHRSQPGLCPDALERLSSRMRSMPGRHNKNKSTVRNAQTTVGCGPMCCLSLMCLCDGCCNASPMPRKSTTHSGRTWTRCQAVSVAAALVRRTFTNDGTTPITKNTRLRRRDNLSKRSQCRNKSTPQELTEHLCHNGCTIQKWLSCKSLINTSCMTQGHVYPCGKKIP